MFGLTVPQAEQVLVLGYQRSTFWKVIPLQSHLYSSLPRNPARPASAKARASRRFFTVPDTFRVSARTVPTGFAVIAAIADVALWCASFLMFAVRTWSRCRLR